MQMRLRRISMYYKTNYASPVGLLTLAADDDNLVGLWIEGQKYHGGTLSGTMTEKNDLTVFGMVKSWLDRYFAGENPTISELHIAPIGSDFRQSVWQILSEIPYGEVTTYGDIAKKMAVQMDKKRMSGQAIGSAVGHNPISIIIPCHRVVGSNGSLTGYAAGIDKKIKLLKLEGASIANLFVPGKGTAL